MFNAFTTNNNLSLDVNEEEQDSLAQLFLRTTACGRTKDKTQDEDQGSARYEAYLSISDIVSSLCLSPPPPPPKSTVSKQLISLVATNSKELFRNSKSDPFQHT